MEAIADGKKRILLFLATGTGKTFIAFQIAWKLFYGHWTLQCDGARRPRILFLADRNILANQAYNSFSAFPEDALARIKPDEYPQDFFDFIIIDECHWGGANDESNWRGMLDYFAPACQLGLTATPKRKDNTDTYRYFGEPVYIYSLKEGINGGFLTPFKVKRFQTTLSVKIVYASRRRKHEVFRRIQGTGRSESFKQSWQKH